MPFYRHFINSHKEYLTLFAQNISNYKTIEAHKIGGFIVCQYYAEKNNLVKYYNTVINKST